MRSVLKAASLLAPWLGAAMLLAAQATFSQVADPAPDLLARNKKNVLAFYDLATNLGKPRDAVERFVGNKYIQHHPEVEDGREGFIAYFEKQAKINPGRKFEFKRVIAEGNLVVLHTRVVFPEAWVRQDWAGIDIFRLDERGKIVEHWNVLQPVPVRTANDNGMF